MPVKRIPIETLEELMYKFSLKRVNKDRGRDTVFILREDQYIKTIESKKSTCSMCENDGVGYVRKVRVGKRKRLVCNNCFAAIVRSRILYG